MKLKIIDNNKNKSKILESLLKNWLKGNNETDFGNTITDLGKSLSVLELTDVVGLNKSEIEKLIISLSVDGYIELFKLDENKNQKNHLYLITEKGQKAIIENHLLNLSADRNRFTLFQFLGIGIGLLGFILALTTFLIQRNSLDPNIEKLQKQLDILRFEKKKISK